MTSAAHDEHISIRDLQRSAASVFDRAHHGQTFIVTRRGETVGRIVPPDPAETAVERAIADGVLDPSVLDALPATADLPGNRETSPPETRLGSDAIAEMRADDR